jgi:hypothetical protein
VQQAAADQLAAIGVRVMPSSEQGARDLLAVANSHTGLNSLFARTHWQGRSGASGTWRQALLRCPQALGSTTAVNFRGVKCRAVLVPLARVLGEYDAATAAEGPPE